MLRLWDYHLKRLDRGALKAFQGLHSVTPWMKIYANRKSQLPLASGMFSHVVALHAFLVSYK